MIPYVEIVDKYKLKAFAQIEPNECWFELSYYDVGECEIYCVATNKNLKALKKGHYVKIPNKRFLWVITSIEYSFSADKLTRMIIAKGKEAKFLLSKRIIEEPSELKTDLIGGVSYLFNRNIGASAGEDRSIANFNLAYIGDSVQIEPIQATRENLLDFTSTLLKTYQFGAYTTLEDGFIYYKPIKGLDRSSYVKFSQSFDNLLSSTYYTSEEDYKTFAYVVSNVEDVDYVESYNTNIALKGVDRSELIVNSNLSLDYKDKDGVERKTTPTSDLYKGWQKEEGKNELSNHKVVEEVSGEIDINNSIYEFDKDFFIGDLVLIQDEYFDIRFTARILKFTMSQDTKVYKEEFAYSAD